MPNPYKKTYIDQNTLLGIPPASPVPERSYHNATTRTNIQLPDSEIRNLEISLDGDINFETDIDFRSNTP